MTKKNDKRDPPEEETWPPPASMPDEVELCGPCSTPVSTPPAHHLAISPLLFYPSPVSTEECPAALQPSFLVGKRSALLVRPVYVASLASSAEVGELRL